MSDVQGSIYYAMSETANFERELVSARPRLIVKSTCLKCGAFTLGRYDDGYIHKWQRKHDCHAPPTTTLLDRLRTWLPHLKKAA